MQKKGGEGGGGEEMCHALHAVSRAVSRSESLSFVPSKIASKELNRRPGAGEDKDSDGYSHPLKKDFEQDDSDKYSS